MEIKHGFGFRSHDLVGLFDKTNKMSTFMNKLEKQSLIDPERSGICAEILPKKYLASDF